MTSDQISEGIAHLAPMSDENRSDLVERAARIIADQRGKPSTDDLTWWATAVLTYEHMLRDQEQSFDLYHSAIVRGQKLWRAAKPAERELIGRDTAGLVAWLLALVERAENATQHGWLIEYSDHSRGHRWLGGFSVYKSGRWDPNWTRQSEHAIRFGSEADAAFFLSDMPFADECLVTGHSWFTEESSQSAGRASGTRSDNG